MTLIFLGASVSIFGRVGRFCLADHSLPQPQPILSRLTAGQHHQSDSIVTTFVQDQGNVSITIRSVLTARARAKKYRLLQLYIGGNPREEVAYRILGIWIQDFHSPYFERNAESRQFAK